MLKEENILIKEELHNFPLPYLPSSLFQVYNYSFFHASNFNISHSPPLPDSLFIWRVCIYIDTLCKYIDTLCWI